MTNEQWQELYNKAVDAHICAIYNSNSTDLRCSSWDVVQLVHSLGWNVDRFIPDVNEAFASAKTKYESIPTWTNAYEAVAESPITEADVHAVNTGFSADVAPLFESELEPVEKILEPEPMARTEQYFGNEPSTDDDIPF